MLADGGSYAIGLLLQLTYAVAVLADGGSYAIGLLLQLTYAVAVLADGGSYTTNIVVNARKIFVSLLRECLKTVA